MSTYQSNPIRFVMSVMAFVLIVALLPARSTSAQVYGRSFTKPQVDQAVWRAAARKARAAASKSHKGDLDRLDFAFMTKIGDAMAKVYIPGTRKAAAFDKLSEEYRLAMQRDHEGIIRAPNIKSVEDMTRVYFDLAAKYPELKDDVVKIWLHTSNEQNYTKIKSEGLIISPSVRKYGLARLIVNQHDAEMGRVFEAGQVSERLSQMLNENYGKSVPDIQNFDARSYMSENKDDPISKVLLDKLKPDGSLEMSLEDIKTLTQAEFGKINASIDDMRDTLVDIDAKQNVLLDYMADREAREQAQAMAAAKAQEHQLKLQASAASIDLFSTLVGFKDPKLARQISTIGNSALQVGESINGWMEAVAGLSTLEKVTSLSTVVATGNIVGAVMNVVSLFGDSEPTPDQMILQEIGKLREQVSELRDEMHDRFDRVDAQLNTIYTTINDRFDMIDVQLGKINGNLVEIQQTLATLENTLSRIERNNFEFMDAANRRPLLNSMNGVLGYQQRTGLALPYAPQFVDAESLFYTWATEHAFDPLSAGPTQRDYSPDKVLGELNAYPLDVNLNYLNGWLLSQGLPPFAEERLPGPRDWLFASRAYTRLGMESPEFLHRINTNDPQRKAEFDAVGNQLETALRRISTQTTVSGTVGNTAIFTGVLAYYNDKLVNFEHAISETERVYLNNLPSQILGRSTPMNLFGGMDQTLTHVPEEFVKMTCGGAYFTPLDTPNSLKNFVPNFNRYNMANYLGLAEGAMKVCLTAEFLDMKEDNCRPDPQDPRLEVCDWVAQVRMTLTVYANDVVVGQQTVSSPHYYTVIDPANPDPTYHAMIYWPYLKSDFDVQPLVSSAFNSTSSTASQNVAVAQQFTTVSNGIEATLGELQQDLYRYMLGQINAGTSSRTRTAAIELAGAKKLLDSFITLGAADALDNDDYLHALMFGDQRVMDTDQIAATYSLSATQPITGVKLLTNPRIALEQNGLKRSLALNQRVGLFLDAITAKTHTEAISFVAGARQDLKLAATFAEPVAQDPTDPQDPPQIRRVFIPVLVR